MEAARLPRIRIDARQTALVGVLIALALVAWLVTDDRMTGMDAGPGTDPGALGFYVGVWVVMMAAMMFPSISPMVLAFAAIQRNRRERGERATGLALFVAGYLVAWTSFGLLAYGVFALGRELDIGALEWGAGGPYLAGSLILLAAGYQLTPLKDVCLRTCRSPLAFVAGWGKPGRWGALRMGVEHGGFCVGCCWALMVALFAVGVMSVGWMAFVAALIAVEKLAPWKRVANLSVAAVLAALALGVAFTPENVPGLTLPDTARSHDAMMKEMP
jgi:predicted metal-binding membrane protein